MKHNIDYTGCLSIFYQFTIAILQITTNWFKITQFLCHSFHGSGFWAWLSWVLRAEASTSLQLRYSLGCILISILVSFSKLIQDVGRIHFRMVVGPIQLGAALIFQKLLRVSCYRTFSKTLSRYGRLSLKGQQGTLQIQPAKMQYNLIPGLTSPYLCLIIYPNQGSDYPSSLLCSIGKSQVLFCSHSK